MNYTDILLEDYKEKNYLYDSDYDERSKYLVADIKHLGNNILKQFIQVLLKIGSVQKNARAMYIRVDDTEYEVDNSLSSIGEVIDEAPPDLNYLLNEYPELAEFLISIGLVEEMDEDDEY